MPENSCDMLVTVNILVLLHEYKVKKLKLHDPNKQAIHEANVVISVTRKNRQMSIKVAQK